MKKGEFKSLIKNNKVTINIFKNARNDFFGHRKKSKIVIPSYLDTKKLLNHLGNFIESIKINSDFNALIAFNAIENEVKNKLDCLFQDFSSLVN